MTHFYHEKQHLQHCLKHALNNLLQREAFSLQQVNKLTDSIGAKRTWILGNYDANVLAAALSLHNMEVKWHDARDLELSSLNLQQVHQQARPVVACNGVSTGSQSYNTALTPAPAIGQQETAKTPQEEEEEEEEQAGKGPHLCQRLGQLSVLQQMQMQEQPEITDSSSTQQQSASTPQQQQLQQQHHLQQQQDIIDSSSTQRQRTRSTQEQQPPPHKLQQQQEVTGSSSTQPQSPSITPQQQQRQPPHHLQQQQEVTDSSTTQPHQITSTRELQWQQQQPPHHLQHQQEVTDSSSTQPQQTTRPQDQLQQQQELQHSQQQQPQQHDKPSQQQQPQQDPLLVGLVLNVVGRDWWSAITGGRHWLAIKYIDGQWWNLDSNLSAPQAFSPGPTSASAATADDGGTQQLTHYLQQQLAEGAHVMAIYQQRSPQQ